MFEKEARTTLRLAACGRCDWPAGAPAGFQGTSSRAAPIDSNLLRRLRLALLLDARTRACGCVCCGNGQRGQRAGGRMLHHQTLGWWAGLGGHPFTEGGASLVSACLR